MTALKPLELGIALLFPLGLLGLLVSLVARQRGRTRRQIAGGLTAIVLCVIAVVATGLWLRAGRGYALLDYSGGAVQIGQVRAADAVGVVVCLSLLTAALLLAKWLTADRGGHDPTPQETVDE